MTGKAGIFPNMDTRDRIVLLFHNIQERRIPDFYPGNGMFDAITRQ